jgi:hypothetical protein
MRTIFPNDLRVSSEPLLLVFSGRADVVAARFAGARAGEALLLRWRGLVESIEGRSLK